MGDYEALTLVDMVESEEQKLKERKDAAHEQEKGAARSGKSQHKKKEHHNSKEQHDSKEDQDKKQGK